MARNKVIVLPEDVQPQWLSVIRRLQSVGKSKGLSIIHITILCDEEGNPVGWTEPKIVMRFWVISGVCAVIGLIIFLLDKTI